jgi:hypothetical protein
MDQVRVEFQWVGLQWVGFILGLFNLGLGSQHELSGRVFPLRAKGKKGYRIGLWTFFRVL